MQENHSTKTTVLLAVLTGFIIAGVASSLWVLEKHKANNSKPTAGQQTTASQAAKVTYQGEDGKTALALLNQHATVALAINGGDTRVESINSVKNAAGKAWHLYVNGTRITADAARYQTHDGDTVVWKFE